MKNVLIGGIGNVLLGDDGVGPHLVAVLASQYDFENGVEIVDLGTPALDLLDRISGKDAVILMDSVDSDGSPGTVQLYTEEDIVRQGATTRMHTHSPALADTLLSADFLGISPGNVLLVGIQGQSYEPSCTLSASVEASLDRAITEVLCQLNRLGIAYRRRERPREFGTWWETGRNPESPASLA
jgi:hydrogenase maturation protease